MSLKSKMGTFLNCLANLWLFNFVVFGSLGGLLFEKINLHDKFLVINRALNTFFKMFK